METWIGEHSEDPDRLYALDMAAVEWIEADKSEDYLLRGGRLDQCEVWVGATSLMLTSIETQFIDTSVEMRRRDELVRLEQSATE